VGISSATESAALQPEVSQNVPFRKNLNLAMALASGTTATAAAEQFGISRKTVQRKLAKPAFRQMVARIRSDMLAAAVGRMADNMSLAADSLVKLLAVDNAAIRLRAARAILGLGHKLYDAVDVDQRLTELENEIARKQGVMA
jgi:hypothetical protein